MIVNNTSNENGDQLIIIASDSAVVGLITLQSFVSDTVGETGSVFYNKEYRISSDGGATFSEWKELTTANIQGEEVLATDVIYIEYRFTQSGDGNLEFNSITLSGDFEEVPVRPNYERSQFNEFFSFLDPRVLQWAGAVLERLILGDEMIHKKVNKESKDYAEFWKGILSIWSYIVILGREFENLFENPILLAEFINQRNLFLCGDEDLSTLQGLASRIYAEFAKRGSKTVLEDNEELQRLICYVAQDEYVTAINDLVGWWVDSESPGFNGEVNFQKNPKIDPVDFAAEYVVSDIGIVVSNADSSIDFLAVPNGATHSFETKLIPVSAQIDYDISFLLSQADPDQDVFNVSVFGYDEAGLLLSLVDSQTGSDSSVAIQNSSSNGILTDNICRVTVFRKDQPLSSENANLYLGQNSNLKMVTGVKFISVRVSVINGSGAPSTLKISKFALRPLRDGYSLGSLVQGNKFQELYLKNNNGTYTNQETENIIRESLLPAGTILTNFLDE